MTIILDTRSMRDSRRQMHRYTPIPSQFLHCFKLHFVYYATHSESSNRHVKFTDQRTCNGTFDIHNPARMQCRSPPRPVPPHHPQTLLCGERERSGPLDLPPATSLSPDLLSRILTGIASLAILVASVESFPNFLAERGRRSNQRTVLYSAAMVGTGQVAWLAIVSCRAALRTAIDVGRFGRGVCLTAISILNLALSCLFPVFPRFVPIQSTPGSPAQWTRKQW